MKKNMWAIAGYTVFMGGTLILCIVKGQGPDLALYWCLQIVLSLPLLALTIYAETERTRK